MGKLHIYKGIGYTAGLGAGGVPSTFPMRVSCTSGLNQNVSVPTTSAGLTLNNLAAGAVCTVTEILPADVAHAPACNNGPAHWQPGPSITQSATIVANSMVTLSFNNWLPCGSSKGWVQVKKIVANLTGGTFSMPNNFPVYATCGVPGLPSHSIQLPLQAGASTSFPARALEKCAVGEKPMGPVPAKGCKSGKGYWTVTRSAPVTVVAGQTKQLTITNTLKCDPPIIDTGGPKNLGSNDGRTLTVTKRVVVDADIPPPRTAFLVKVNCSGMGPGKMIRLSAGKRETLSGIPVGSNCTIMEAEPEVPTALMRRGCRWLADTEAKRVRVGAKGASVTIVNHWDCNGRGTKRRANDPGDVDRDGLPDRRGYRGDRPVMGDYDGDGYRQREPELPRNPYGDRMRGGEGPDRSGGRD